MVSDLINTNVTQPENIDSRLPAINIWTRKNVADMTQYERTSAWFTWKQHIKINKFFFRFSYNLTTKILPFFEEYFGINFKLPKIDMVAVPDFGFSAMENWGLITFRYLYVHFSSNWNWQDPILITQLRDQQDNLFSNKIICPIESIKFPLIRRQSNF